MGKLVAKFIPINGDKGLKWTKLWGCTKLAGRVVSLFVHNSQVCIWVCRLSYLQSFNIPIKLLHYYRLLYAFYVYRTTRFLK